MDISDHDKDGKLSKTELELLLLGSCRWVMFQEKKNKLIN